mgnify:CR=1 FL=1
MADQDWTHCGERPGLVANLTATIPIPPGALVVSAAPPDAITQRNVEAVLGLTGAEFKRLLGLYPGHVTALGRLRLVRRTDFAEWLLTYRSTPVASKSSTEQMDAEELHAVAAAVGMVVREPASGRRRK